MRTPPKNRLNLTGLVFGRLTVIEEGERRNKQRRWYCRCECGNTTLIDQPSLRERKTTSCGCFHKEIVRASLSTHGLSKTPEYQAWSSMKARCNNPNFIEYHHYGGKGIRVCDQWVNDFVTFLADMGQKPSAEHSLDRIDGNKDYSPDNCRWATSTMQNTNRSMTHLITLNGKTLSLTEWAKETGIPRKTISARIHRFKWSEEKALTTPVK